MTKEQRAQKWFSNMPNTESISLEMKMNIYSKVEKKMSMIFFGTLVIELILLVALGGGQIFILIADFLNRIPAGHTANSRKGVAIVGCLVLLPFTAIPLAAALVYKKKAFQAEAGKFINSIKENRIKDRFSSSIKSKETEDFLYFDNLNFKLAIIQVLMYDLKLLKPYFDIYDFASKCTEEDVDTDSYTIIEPALDYFKNLSIPKDLGTYVETIYMDGGNDVYMNIIPQWDGEDNCFDLNEITLVELQQFSNLKKATVMSSNFDKIKELFDAAGVEIDSL